MSLGASSEEAAPVYSPISIVSPSRPTTEAVHWIRVNESSQLHCMIAYPNPLKAFVQCMYYI